METKYIVPDIKKALDERRHPTVVLWNRLEGRPRTLNFDRALKAEVRDALWMLTKQWQVGEFTGDDAGSPVLAKVHIETTQLTKYKPGTQVVQPFETHVPLETTVEQKKIIFSWDEKNMQTDLRLNMGRYWLKLLRDNGLATYRSSFIKQYGFSLPAKDKSSAHIYAHREVWQQLAAISGRSMDGAKLYLYLKESAAHHASDTIDPLMPLSDQQEMDDVGKDFVKWFDSFYYQPKDEKQNAWDPSRLEYNFSCSAPGNDKEKVLVADEYYHGHLDWYAFDIDNNTTALADTGEAQPAPGKFTSTFIPTHVQFDGMPNTRWWMFEDGQTNLGDIKPSTTDLAKLLLVEFGLVFANDWFLIPFQLPVGSLANVKGLAVSNTFGERFWIEASGKGADEDWQRWNMFTLNVKGQEEGQQADTTLLLAPAAIKVQDGDPIEEVLLIRDEMANMVWAVETIVPLANGYGRRGKEAALETYSYFEKLVNAAVLPPVEYKAPISYLAMTNVPENWIPFVPVHIDNNNREIQLQRASMLRFIEGDDPDKPDKIRPKTILMRDGLDSNLKTPYYIHEEEIPRAGIKVTQAFQRTRWTNGEVFVWLGAQKTVGRGEGSSGLAFDQIKDVKQ
jgi:hypothetical protein